MSHSFITYYQYSSDKFVFKEWKLEMTKPKSRKYDILNLSVEGMFLKDTLIYILLHLLWKLSESKCNIDQDRLDFYLNNFQSRLGWLCWCVVCLGSGNCAAGGAAAGLGRGDPGRGSRSAMGEALVPRGSGGSHHRDLLVSQVYSMSGWFLHIAILLSKKS